MIPAISSHIALIESSIQEISLPGKPENLYEPIRYFMSLGGKRMRPVLLLLGHELFGGKAKDVIPQALAVEIFHNFSLVHDDIMDNAPLRRAKATVHEKWNRNIAILSGDAMLVKAYEYLGQTHSPHFKKIFDLFNKTALEVCEGQQYDMDFENQSVSIADYLEMIRLKTSVLLGASLTIGAILANASDKDCEHLYQFGQHLGIAFQLQDDLLDAFGDPEKFGKKTGGDIAANKKTYLMLTALQDAEGATKEALTSALLLHKHDEKITRILAIFEQLNVKEKTRAEMDKHFATAKSHLEKIEAETGQKNILLQLSESLMIRVH